MPPNRIIFIRHAEKPVDDIDGVTEQGRPSPHSLIPRGWQRAGALVRLFDPRHPTDPTMTLKPDTLYAAGVGPGDHSRRELETATPMSQAFAEQGIPFITNFLKDQHREVAGDVGTRSGTVLLVWEHSQIPALADLVAPGTDSPGKWPDDRFDLIWVFERVGNEWTFCQHGQALLAGDAPDPGL